MRPYQKDFQNSCFNGSYTLTPGKKNISVSNLRVIGIGVKGSHQIHKTDPQLFNLTVKSHTNP